MTTRRLFLQSTAATTGLVAAGAIPESTLAAPPPATLYRVLGDSRYAESLMYLKEAERLGHRVVMTNGDVTRVWYEDLYGRWKQGPAAIAGLTGHGALFCLERWAWEHGMRVVFRADHRRMAGGGVEHLVAARESEPLRATLQAAAEHYPVEAARMAGRLAFGTYQVCSHPGVSCAPYDPEPLVSWVIAPIARV